MGLDASADPAEFIRELNAEIGLPENLREMGVQKDAIADLSNHTARMFARSLTLALFSRGIRALRDRHRLDYEGILCDQWVT